MREILFRGKTDKGEWVEGYVFEMHILGDKTTYISTKPFMLCNDGDFDYEPFAVDTETVGQYTGLTDKNGNKIFEGDIIKTDNGRISAISVVQYGKFEPKMFYDLLEDYVRPRPKEKMYGLFAKSKRGEEMLLSECSHLIEVIGNIHDNPELLKGGAE